MEAFKADSFLILPHPEVETYMRRKTSDYDRWLKGMRKLQARFVAGVALKREQDEANQQD